jgi:poly(3-hydroxybutyrate) depolymerase
MLKSFISIKIFFLIVFLFEGVSQPLINTDTLVLKKALLIELERSDGSNVLTPNAVVASVETGKWNIPKENAEFTFNNKISGKWKKNNSDENGWFKDISGNSILYLQHNSDKEEVVILEAMGHSMVYVNGSPRSGNPYRSKDLFEDWEPRFDYSLIPVKLRKGLNEFLFDCNRGMLKVKIHKDVKDLILNSKDLTVPDILINNAVNTYGAISIINATEDFQKNLFIKTWSGDSNPEYYPVNQLNPLSIYKTPFYIKLPAQQNEGKIKLNIELVNKSTQESEDKVFSTIVVDLNAVKPGDIHKETFISKMDGSVQYYAVNPPTNLTEKPAMRVGKHALFLSLHGAGVEAINQANAYGHKNWGYLVAPTNRRPYGYNWENWGRLDALEVLDIAMEKFNIDENRVYLTGHSMGGHGTWHLGINYPDKFAAIGPSAGWISIWGYRIRPSNISSEVGQVLIRSAKQSDTYALSPNLKGNGIYIIHGSEDDNVRPEQAYSIIDTISKFHKNFIYHEEPGVGHWWDHSDEPGADCVDWMPMFDYFAHHSVPGKERIKSIDFMTANPAISSKNNWIEIINQVVQQKMSKIDIKLLTGGRKFVGTTDNIETLVIDASVLTSSEPVSVELDNQLLSDIKIPDDKKIYLAKKDNKWEITNEPSKQNKYPSRTGNFREALNHDVVFVYGTEGNKEENEWAFEKARYDAERIWYQGNGSIEVVKDEEFDAAKFKDRNVVIYGNSETNSAWNALLGDSPIQVNDGGIVVGEKEYDGDDLACLLIRPIKDSEVASVGVVGGTGIEGMKLANFAESYHPYVSFPDVVIYNSDIINSDEKGVKLTGYFGNDWSLESGEFLGQLNSDKTD